MSDWTFFNHQEQLQSNFQIFNLEDVLSIMFKKNIIMQNIQINLSCSFKNNILRYMNELISFLQQFVDIVEIPTYELFLCKFDFIIILFLNLNFQDQNDEKEFLILEFMQYYSAGDERNISRIYTTGLFTAICNMIKMTNPNDIEKYNLFLNIFENIMISDQNSINLMNENGIFKHVLLISNDISELKIGKDLIASFYRTLSI